LKAHLALIGCIVTMLAAKRAGQACRTRGHAQTDRGQTVRRRCRTGIAGMIALTARGLSRTGRIRNGQFVNGAELSASGGHPSLTFPQSRKSDGAFTPVRDVTVFRGIRSYASRDRTLWGKGIGRRFSGVRRIVFDR
jgi:hypothetical protein